MQVVVTIVPILLVFGIVGLPISLLFCETPRAVGVVAVLGAITLLLAIVAALAVYGFVRAWGGPDRGEASTFGLAFAGIMGWGVFMFACVWLRLRVLEQRRSSRRATGG